MEEKTYEIPPEGSLGLLALGYAGLTLWREKRAAHEAVHGKYPGFYSVRKDNNKDQAEDTHEKDR